MIARGEKPPDVEYIPENIPATNPGEPIPDKYKELTPFIDEPLPPGTDYLVPAVVPEEGERKIDAVLRQLKDGVETIQDSSQFRLFLTTMSKFHDYSIGNLILIAIQRPAATHVAGFQTWKDLGRWVKKGSTGIAILAPVMPPKPKKEEKEDEEEEVPLTPVYFKVVHVFDISQTEGKPLPEFDIPVLTGEANEELFAKALALAKAQGLEINFEPRPQQDPAIKGQYLGKTIWVKGDEPRAQQLKSLLHEMAHYYSEGVFQIPRRDAETIAESAAFAVGAHFGFDSGNRSFPYVALWAQDKKVLQANLASIRKVTTVILEGIEKLEVVIEGMEKLTTSIVGNEIICIRCGKHPAEYQKAHWLPICRECNKEIFKLPRAEMLKEMKRLWDKFSNVGSEVIEGKLVPALRPFEPYHFAEYVLRYNRFSDAEIPIYSGLTSRSPLRVPDHIWREVIQATEGDFVKQGDLNVFHIPEKERPAYMRAAPTWRDVTSTIPSEPDGEIVKMYCQKCGKEVEKPSDFRTPENLRIYMITGLCQLCQDKEQAQKYFKEKGEFMPATGKKPFINVGDRVRLVLGKTKGKFRYGHWPKDVWLGDQVISGTVVQYRPEQPAVRIGDEYFEKIEEWAVVNWDNGADTAIGPEKEDKSWERVKSTSASVIPTKPSTPNPKEELEFVSDSPELIPFTIEEIGYRDKLDNAFETAIARVKGR